MEKIYIEINCNSEECEQLREQGLFFETIAEAIGVSRSDIEEIDNNN